MPTQKQLAARRAFTRLVKGGGRFAYRGAKGLSNAASRSVVGLTPREAAELARLRLYIAEQGYSRDETYIQEVKRANILEGRAQAAYYANQQRYNRLRSGIKRLRA